MNGMAGHCSAAAIIARLVLPVSVTRAPGERWGWSAPRRVMLARIGAASTTRSAPATPARPVAASIGTIWVDGHRRTAAWATDPPINPKPTIAMRLNWGASVTQHLSTGHQHLSTGHQHLSTQHPSTQHRLYSP